MTPSLLLPDEFITISKHLCCCYLGRYLITFSEHYLSCFLFEFLFGNGHCLFYFFEFTLASFCLTLLRCNSICNASLLVSSL